MATVTNVHGLKAGTGGQAGTMDIQFLLIKAYDKAFNLTQTANNDYEYSSDSNDGLAQIVAIVQDFAEIYYIGVPEANSGGENDLTRVIIGINPNTARGLPEGVVLPSATGNWSELESALGGGSEAWFAIPGQGWNWWYND